MRKTTKYPNRHGDSWSYSEYCALKKAIYSNMSLDEIAKKHQRTVYAIQCAIKKKFPHINDMIINGKNYSDKFKMINDMIINGKNYSDKLNKIIQIINLKVDIL